MSVITIITYIFIALSIILALFTIFNRKNGNGTTYFITKCFASAVFVFVGIFSYLESSASKLLIVFVLAGLLFGFLGDAVLGGKEINKQIEKKPFIIFGILAFLLGHIFFSVGFIKTTGVNLWVFIIPLILSFVALIIFILLKYKGKAPLYGLLTVYAFLEALMCCSAGYLMMTNIGNVGYAVAFAGSVFFCLSDSVLSYVYFGPNKNRKNLLVIIELSTYYIAQILISASILFM